MLLLHFTFSEDYPDLRRIFPYTLLYIYPHGKMIGGFKKNSISLLLKSQMPQQVCGT